MNGATAEPWVNTTSAPKSTSTSTIGPSHHFFRTRRKSQSSRGNDGCAGLGMHMKCPVVVARLSTLDEASPRLAAPPRPVLSSRHGTVDAARGSDADPAGDPPAEARSGGRCPGPPPDRAGPEGPDGQQRPELGVRGGARPGGEGTARNAKPARVDPLWRHRATALPQRPRDAADHGRGPVAGRPLHGYPGDRRGLPAGDDP